MFIYIYTYIYKYGLYIHVYIYKYTTYNIKVRDVRGGAQVNVCPPVHLCVHTLVHTFNQEEAVTLFTSFCTHVCTSKRRHSYQESVCAHVTSYIQHTRVHVKKKTFVSGVDEYVQGTHIYNNN